MTVIDGRWPFAGREGDVRDAMTVLAADAGHGVVLVGPSGVGKTIIAQQVLASLSRHFDHIYLRGSAAHSTTPYGALNVLLAELDEDTARSPLLVLSALQRKFAGATAKRPTLMHIDGVEDIDELSATVIAHLARVGAVRLLVTCEDLLRAPGEFFDLWKDGVLERFDIQPLTLAAATELLAAAFGAPVSRSAAQELWSASGGNPKYLQMATKADVISGHLFSRDGIWVTQDAPRPDSGRSVTDWTATKLAALPPEDRAAVEVLAVSGSLPVVVLLKAVPATTVDALQSDGVITVDIGASPLVRLTYEVFADVVRAQLLSGAGREALRTVAGLRDEAGVPVHARTTLALWALDNAEAPAAVELVGLARLANDHCIEGAARRLLDAVPADDFGSTAVIERTRQLWIEGHVAGALGTVEALLTHDRLPLADWVDARLLAARLRARTHGREHGSEDLLDDIGSRLDGEAADDVVLELRGRTDVVRLELDVFEGRFEKAAARVSDVLATWAEDTRWNIRIRSLASVVDATLGSQEQGVAVARTVTSRLVNSPSDPLDREAAIARLYECLFLAGHWNECFDLATDQGTRFGGRLFGGSPSEFAEGVLLAYLGRSRLALEKLLPAISQFRIRDRHGFLPLAEAAAAYAQVLESDPDAAEDHLRAIDLNGRRYSWHLREAVRYFSLLAEAWLDTPEVIATELMEHALELGAKGYRGAELFFLSQSVQLGRHEAAELLAASAAATDGPLADLAAGFAEGLTARDPGALKEVALLAVDAGNHNLAGDVAALSIEHLSDNDDPMIRVHAEQILRKTSTPARRHVRRKLLSERERAIARMVARGVPNKEIAQQEHISPRTVEGHVHQIMSKLGLSSRKQLSLIFGQQQ